MRPLAFSFALPVHLNGTIPGSWPWAFHEHLKPESRWWTRSCLQLETLIFGPWSGWARPGVELDVTSSWTALVVFLTARFFAFLIAAADCLAGLAAAGPAALSSEGRERHDDEPGAQHRDARADVRGPSQDHVPQRPLGGAQDTPPIVLSAYTELLRKRQVQAVVGSAVVAGLNVGAPLAIVLMVQRETGSFAQAGAVTAALAISSAIANPVQGRLIDRFGQTRVIVPMAIGGAIAISALVAATLAGAPIGALLAIAAVTGAISSSLLPSMRPLWADLVDHPRQLGIAYAIQAVLTEVLFILGPLAAALLIAVGSPAAAVLAIAGARLAGMLAFASTQASRRWRAPRKRHWAGALTSAGMLTLIFGDIPLGAMFGALDVAVPAFAKAEGAAAAAGIALAALAVGSMLGGIVYGGDRGGSTATGTPSCSRSRPCCSCRWRSWTPWPG